MKKTNFAVPVLGLLIFLCGQTVYSQVNIPDNRQTEQKRCGLITDGIEFCIETPFISVEMGEDVFLTYSMKNITREDITTRFGRNSIKDHFAVKITDKAGNKVLTDLEKLIEKRKNENISEKGQVYKIISGRGPATFCFEPTEKFEWNLNLSKTYSFDKKGIYYVEIRRNDLEQSKNKNNLTLIGKAEIEIK